jgi:hypothetical protein
MPTPGPDPVDTIERFAELSAMQDDPFAEGEAVLRVVGLDEEAWEEIEKAWLARLAAGTPDAEALALRFGETYARTLERLAAAAGAEPASDTRPSGPRFLSAEAQPWRAEARHVGRDVAADAPPLASPEPAAAAPSLPHARALIDTQKSPAWQPAPALPFRAPAGPDHDAEGATLELHALLPPPALPFATPKP